MKIILVIILSVGIALAKTNTAFIGAGAYIQTQPYKGVSARIVPSPVIFFDNKIFYIRWSKIGIYLAGEKKQNYSWALSLAAQPCTFGYQASNSDSLKGMSNKNNSVEAGLELDATYKTLFLNILSFHDILNASNSYMAHIELGDTLKYKNLTFYPSILAIYYTDKFNNYYYGINRHEATPTRPYYHAGGGFNYAAQTYIRYKITKKWYILSYIRAEYLNKTLQKSPIVNSRYIYSGLLSVIYKLSF